MKGILLILLSAVLIDGPGDNDWLEKAAVLAGVQSVEELTEEQAEWYESLYIHKIRINTSRTAVLDESGLFTPYQLASLLDYRQQSGDVLSVAELSLLDGFGEEFAHALAPFIEFSSDNLPGRKSYERKNVNGDLMLNAGIKMLQDSPAYSYSGKYKLDAWDRLGFGIAAKKYLSAESAIPGNMSSYLSYNGTGWLSRLVIGDFHTRFGQGLGLWSGFAMSAFQSAESFYKRPTGISPALSYSISGHRGVGAVLAFGKIRISPFVSFPSLRSASLTEWSPGWEMLSGLNCALLCRNGQLSLTGYCGTDGGFRLSASNVSADFRFCIRGFELFGETAFDIMNRTAAAVAGAYTTYFENLKMAVSLRYIPAEYDVGNASPQRSFSGKKGERAVSAGVTMWKLYLGADIALRQADNARQMKIYLRYPLDVGQHLSMDLKLSERLRTWDARNRSDIRLDTKYLNGRWQGTFRMNAVRSVSWGLLGYAEYAYGADKLSVFIRGNIFRIDNWDDRVYVYERDAPGSFNVPAYYGRGVSSSLFAKYAFGISRLRVSSYARVSYCTYPFSQRNVKTKKPDALEVRLSFVCKF